MAEQLLIGRSRFPSARPARCVAANAVPGVEWAPFIRVLTLHELSHGKHAMRSIRKVANGLAFTILLLFAALTVALLVSCAPAADVKSGLQPGDSVPVFHPLNVTGQFAGEKQCLV